MLHGLNAGDRDGSTPWCEPAQCPWVRVQEREPLLSSVLSAHSPCVTHWLGGLLSPPATFAEISYLLLIYLHAIHAQQLSRLHGLSMSMATRAVSRLENVRRCQTMRVAKIRSWYGQH